MARSHIGESTRHNAPSTHTSILVNVAFVTYRRQIGFLFSTLSFSFQLSSLAYYFQFERRSFSAVQYELPRNDTSVFADCLIYPNKSLLYAWTWHSVATGNNKFSRVGSKMKVYTTNNGCLVCLLHNFNIQCIYLFVCMTVRNRRLHWHTATKLKQYRIGRSLHFVLVSNLHIGCIECPNYILLHTEANYI